MSTSLTLGHQYLANSTICMNKPMCIGKKLHVDITNTWESKSKEQLVGKVHKCQHYVRLKLGWQEKCKMPYVECMSYLKFYDLIK